MTIYWAAYLLPDKSLDFYVMKPVCLPVALGILHEKVSDHFDLCNTVAMTADQTRAAMVELRVAA